MHSHSMMWDHRGSLLSESGIGHADLSRLQRGNVALQVFIAATKLPLWVKSEDNGNSTNLLTLLALFQKWPMKTWFSNTEKALYQYQVLDTAVEKSQGRLVKLTTRNELEHFLEQRATNKSIVSALYAAEGAHVFDGNLENVELLYKRGVRMVGVSHFHDSEFGGSRHGKLKYGLTALGRQMLKKIIGLGMIVDLSHASDALMDDIIAETEQAQTPLVMSHTGVRKWCDTVRNVEDKYLTAIGKRGGLVGICLLQDCLCGTSVADFVKHVKHVIATIGEDHVVLGSDMDGGAATILQPQDWSALYVELSRAGLSSDQLAKIMGQNVLHFLQRAWK